MREAVGSELVVGFRMMIVKEGRELTGERTVIEEEIAGDIVDGGCAAERGVCCERDEEVQNCAA